MNIRSRLSAVVFSSILWLVANPLLGVFPPKFIHPDEILRKLQEELLPRREKLLADTQARIRQLESLNDERLTDVILELKKLELMMRANVHTLKTLLASSKYSRQ